MIKKATLADIPIIEDIYADVCDWLENKGLSLWTKNSVLWPELSKKYSIDDFYIAYENDIPVGCIVLMDFDPMFWPNIEKGKALYIHKFAVKKIAVGKGVSSALLDFAKNKCRENKIKFLCLDCHGYREKLRMVSAALRKEG